jgi:DNA-binding Xre family transcriptional regulator
MSEKLRNRFFVLLTEKERQENRRITQTEIADRLGISIQTVGRWLRNEVDRFDAPVVEKFCDYFGCEVGDLLYIDRS